jgi:hypothetical protein
MSDDWDEHKSQRIPEIRDLPPEPGEMSWLMFFLGMVTATLVIIGVLGVIGVIAL